MSLCALVCVIDLFVCACVHLMRCVRACVCVCGMGVVVVVVVVCV